MRIRELGKWLAAFAVLFISALSVAAEAGDVVFESCVDSRGRLLKAISDTQQAMLVRAVVETEEASIRYNPERLSRLSPQARLFLYAQECARVGDAAGSPSLESARLADCKGVSALLASGAVKRKDLPALQAELSFTAEEWALLTGPQRTFELGSCLERRGNVLTIPRTAPTAQQAGRNDCVRACGDRLWSCQKQSCSGADCPSCWRAYDTCQAACAAPGK